MDTDGRHRSQYDPSASERLLGEAARLMRALGLAAHHMTLIGGIAPSLLVRQLDPGIEPHVGTADLDVCLSVAIMDGDTAQYERIDSCLREAGFRPHTQSWRWIGGDQMPLMVEFFCPTGADRVPGRPFRPRSDDSPRARENIGSRLSAIPLIAGALISRDTVIVECEVELPGARGRMTMPFRVTGPSAFLAAKAEALRGRDKPKDSYDIIWLLDAWPDGPAGLAEVVLASACYREGLLRDTFAILDDRYRDAGRAGAVAYARFLAGSGDPAILAEHAVGAVAELLRAIP